LIGFWVGILFSTVAVYIIRNARSAEAWGERLADYADELDLPFQQDLYDFELEGARRIAPQVIVRRVLPGKGEPSTVTHTVRWEGGP
jgi:hypothetical protein